ALGVLAIFAGFYAIYLLYLGIPRLMKAPQDKALPYTAVIIVVAIVLAVIIGMIGGLFVSMPGSRFAANTSSSDVQFDKNSPLGKLEAIAKKAEESTQKVEAATRAGDRNAAAAAAVEVLGALLGGGKPV